MFKEKYEHIQSSIQPDSQLIQETIEKCTIKGENTMKFKFKKPAWIMAACVMMFASAVNVSPAFAASIEDIPILGSIARVISVHTYIEEKEDYDVTVKQPVMEDFIDVNKIIETTIEEYKKSAEISINEYKNAFISTGGTEEQFQGKDIQVQVNHQVKTNNKQYTSFVLEMYESWLSASAQYEYYNLDSNTGESITLEDLLGAEYISIANEVIQEEIQNAGEEGGYFQGDAGGFTSITEETSFYINEDGNPIIVFEKYEITNGAMGRPEFEIKR